MGKVSFDRISFLYDFIERFILKDYQGSLDLMDKYLILKKSDDVIDIGSGTGFFSQAIVNNVSSIISVDPSKKMLLKNKNHDISNIQGDGANLGIKDDSFDLALIINVLHHIQKEKQIEFISEAYRLLKKQGRIFIIEVVLPKTFLNKLFCFFEELLVGKTYHISAEKLEYELTKIRFLNVKMIYSKEHNWKYIAIGKK
jgi:ubiquinone/menaquinone biosynthesis C-methylase UbiE